MREIAERIADEARRAGEVIRRLRAFLRKGESVLRDCDLNHVVTQPGRLGHSAVRASTSVRRIRRWERGTSQTTKSTPFVFLVFE